MRSVRLASKIAHPGSPERLFGPYSVTIHTAAGCQVGVYLTLYKSYQSMRGGWPTAKTSTSVLPQPPRVTGLGFATNAAELPSVPLVEYLFAPSVAQSKPHALSI